MRVIIADDHLLFIDGLVSLLKNEKDIHVACIAHNGRQLLDIIRTECADLILLDINMPGLNGLDTLKQIKDSWPSLHVIMLSTYNEPNLIEKAKANGANGYLLKNCNKDDLIQTIHLVASGQSCFPYQKPHLYNTDGPDKFLKQFNLSKRELEIMKLLKEGLTNKQIAEKLFLSIFTVETHRKNIMQKLDLKSPAALIKFNLEFDI